MNDEFPTPFSDSRFMCHLPLSKKQATKGRLRGRGLQSLAFAATGVLGDGGI